MIITDYLNELSLDLNCHGLIIHSYEYSSSVVARFKEDELVEVINKVKKKFKVFLNVDSLIEESKLLDFKNYLLKFQNKVDYIIFSDYSVLEYVDKNKCIYNANTLIASFSEIKSIDTLTFISNELSLNQIKEIMSQAKANKLENKICLNVFGYMRMMYSKRPLLTMFNDSLLESEVIYTLKEELRTDFYKMIQTNNGSFMYSDHIYFLEENFDCFLKRIDSFNLSHQEIIDACNYFLGLSENIFNNFIKRGFLDYESFLKKDNYD